MGSGKKEEGQGRPDRDAADWFAENESDQELDAETAAQWEQWCTDPRNLDAYLRILEIRRQINLLPTPSTNSTEELLRDALPEHGLDVFIRKKLLN